MLIMPKWTGLVLGIVSALLLAGLGFEFWTMAFRSSREQATLVCACHSVDDARIPIPTLPVGRFEQHALKMRTSTAEPIYLESASK
jgi:hypothetical protein